MSVYIENYRLNKLKYLLSLAFISLNIVFYFFSIGKLEFYKIYFSIFVFLSLFNFLFSFNLKSFFFQKFFTFYMWLAFTFFYYLHILFFDQQYTFSIGNFDHTNSLHLKELYIVLIFFNLGILLSSLISRKFFIINYSKDKLKINSFFTKNINYLLLLISVFILIIFYINFTFKLFDYYYFSESRFNFIVDSFLKWFFLFGFTSIMCIFLDLNVSRKIIIKLFIISSFQEFLFYFSILSRGCIFNSLALLFALISKNYIKQNYSLKLITFLSSIVTILFILNFYFLIDFRGGDNFKMFQKYRGTSIIPIENIDKDILLSKVTWVSSPKVVTKEIINQSEGSERSKVSSNSTVSEDAPKEETSVEILEDISVKNEDKPFKHFKIKMRRLFFVIKNRLFGIDSLMALVAHENKSFDLLKDSLKEEFNPGISSFFDTIRLQSSELEKANNVTLPTILGLLYYSGSSFFVFSSIFFIILFFNFIERFNIFLNNNIFLSALIGQLCAYRLWHFGYAPINSYKFILSIILSIVITYIIKELFIKFKILLK